MEIKKQAKHSFFGDISISKKIIASFILLITIASIPTFYAFKGLGDVVSEINKVFNEKAPVLRNIQATSTNLDNTLINMQKIILDDRGMPKNFVDELNESFFVSKAILTKMRYGVDSPELNAFKSKLKSHKELFETPMEINLSANFKQELEKLINVDYENYHHQMNNTLEQHKQIVEYYYEIDGMTYSISSLATKIFMDFRDWNNKLSNAVQYDVPFKGETNYKESLFYNWYENTTIKDKKIALVLNKINGYNKRIYESAARINQLSGVEKEDIFEVQTKTDFKNFEKELSNLVRISSQVFSKLSVKQSENIHELEMIAHGIDGKLSHLETAVRNDVANAEQNLQTLSDRVYEIVLIAMVVGIIVCLFLSQALIYAIVRPLVYMSKAMRKISEGDINVYLKESNRKDEIGVMTQALFIFKKNKIASDAMALERHLEQEKALLAERKETEEQKIVLDKVGHIVTQCVKGDFSGRIDTTGLDSFIKEIANGMNQIGEISHKGLSEIKHSLEDLSKGILSTRIQGNYQGMFLEIKDAFNGTAQKLEETVEEIIISSGEIKDSSQEISTSCSDLAKRSEKQVITIEETSSSMDELSTTIKSNSNNSLEASNFAKSARGIAEKGGIVIKEVVASMSQINESSTKISNIINVINEIAFRTNLLALNASIEAARAGEAGKGFSVVAAEVRALAGRAKESAEEIQELVTRSVRQVYDGSSLVNDAGDTLSEVIESFNRVSTLMEDIAIASEQQTVGIERIRHAVAVIDDNTVHNSSLVGQTATSAHTLAHLGDKLTQLVGFFQTSNKEQDFFPIADDNSDEPTIDKLAS